jgi:hypothetical protein
VTARATWSSPASSSIFNLDKRAIQAASDRPSIFVSDESFQMGDSENT